MTVCKNVCILGASDSLVHSLYKNEVCTQSYQLPFYIIYFRCSCSIGIVSFVRHKTKSLFTSVLKY